MENNQFSSRWEISLYSAIYTNKLIIDVTIDGQNQPDLRWLQRDRQIQLQATLVDPTYTLSIIKTKLYKT